MASNSTVLKKDSRRDSLKPVSNNDRIFGFWSYFTFWISSTIVIQLFIVGQGFVPPIGQLNILQATVASVVSTLIVALMYIINSDAGLRYGIPFIVHARSAFGFHGARIASLIRVLPAVIWYGIGSWIGADAAGYIVNLIWGVEMTGILFVGFVVLQIGLTYYGIETAKWFNSSLSVVVLGFLIYLISRYVSVGGADILNHVGSGGTWGMPFFAAITAAVGILLTGAVNIADLTRYLKPTKLNNWGGHMLGIVPMYLLLLFSGMFATIVTEISNPIAAMVYVIPNDFVAIVFLLFIIVAQVTTNLTLNIIPPAVVLMETFNVRWGLAAIIVGLLGVVTFPWLLIDNAAFNALIGIYSAFLGPLFGVMLADYFLVRKTKLNIDELYDPNIKYKWLGFVALIIGGIFGIMFLSISWMVGLPISALAYWVGNKIFPQVQHDTLEKAQ
ncbi:cytosine permease [Oceanobacillus alkalisoli]|uniref:cytosine permease n=1 Tax=Oceanobacillus alkalisoli TaxID=2925113 RepID=UPI001F11EC0F|nr:cytosine permease [Oceanobacillus alkalisoli]MCF3944133.1 cytosine permease [Oceanobacillus alkalisoli]